MRGVAMKTKLDWAVPVWFLSVGTVGTMYTPTSVAVAVVSFVIALIVIPFVALAVSIYGPRRLFLEWRLSRPRRQAQSPAVR